MYITTTTTTKIILLLLLLLLLLTTGKMFCNVNKFIGLGLALIGRVNMSPYSDTSVSTRDERAFVWSLYIFLSSDCVLPLSRHA